MPGAFKLDHLQPFKPILFWNFYNFFTFILGSPFLLPQMKRECEKGILQMDEAQGFQYLGQSNWTICSPWCRFFHIFSILSLRRLTPRADSMKEFERRLAPHHAVSRFALALGLPFLITIVQKIRKIIHPKIIETQVFLYHGRSNWTIYSLLSQFCSKKFQSSWALYWGSHFLLPQSLESRRAENEM